MKKFMFITFVAACVFTAWTAAHVGDVVAGSLVPGGLSSGNNRNLHLIELYDCSGCSKGGHCPKVCATSSRPRPDVTKANANTHGCACLHNESTKHINFRYHWGTGAWKNVNMRPGFQYSICWRYGGDTPSSPPLQFELDVDMTKGNSWTTYDIGRVQTVGNTCRAVPAGAHYTVKYRPGTNKQFIAVYKRSS